MLGRFLAAAWSYELASWLAFLAVVTRLEAEAGAAASGLYFVLYNGVQLPAAAVLGPWLDRLDRGRGFALALVLPLPALAFALGAPSLTSGLFLGAAYALSDYLLFALVPAAVPQLVPMERVSRANALWQTGSGVIFAAAPAAAGLGLERLGYRAVLLLAGLLLGTALLLWPGRSLGRVGEGAPRGGWGAVLAAPLAAKGALAVFWVALGGGLVNAALPVLTGGGEDYGIVLSAIGAGGLLTTLLFTRVPLARPLRLAGAGALAHAAGDLLLLAGVYLPAGVLKGGANAAFTLGLDTALQLELSPRVLARAFSLGWAVGNLGQMMGAGAFAAFARPLGARVLLGFSAGFALLALVPLKGAGAALRRPRGEEAP